MNSVAILFLVFCIFFVWVAESTQNIREFCDLIENEDGLKTATDCFEKHLHPFVNNLVSECYEDGFDEDGSMVTYLGKFCQRDVYQNEIKATIDCLRENHDDMLEEAEMDEEDLRHAARQAEECWRAKMPSAGDETSNELEEIENDQK